MAVISPGAFFRNFKPEYWRESKLLDLVFDNIDYLYKPYHASGTNVVQGVTLYTHPEMVKARFLLGYYKQTWALRQDILADIADCNRLLKDNHLSPHDFTGEEISNAEHFCAAATIAMVPAIGGPLSLAASFFWEEIVGTLSAMHNAGGKIWNGGDMQKAFRQMEREFQHNDRQLTGPDWAGCYYGLLVLGEVSGGSLLTSYGYLDKKWKGAKQELTNYYDRIWSDARKAFGQLSAGLNR